MYGNTLYFASARNVGGKHTVRTMSILDIYQSTYNTDGHIQNQALFQQHEIS
jgi:hypothetical protein